MDVLDAHIRIARKEHKCNYCCGIIKIGEKYDWSKFSNYGEIYEWKAHLSCCDIASELDMADSSDDGITKERFMRIIDDEYNLIRNTNEELPSFDIRLKEVKCKYGIE